MNFNHPSAEVFWSRAILHSRRSTYVLLFASETFSPTWIQKGCHSTYCAAKCETCPLNQWGPFGMEWWFRSSPSSYMPADLRWALAGLLVWGAARNLAQPISTASWRKVPDSAARALRGWKRGWPAGAARRALSGHLCTVAALLRTMESCVCQQTQHCNTYCFLTATEMSVTTHGRSLKFYRGIVAGTLSALTSL